MRSILLSAVILISPALSLFAQQMGAFGTYAFSYDAEAIRLGGAYTAVGRGLAAMHSNTAALAFQQGAQLQFSTGRSLLLEDSEFNTPYSIAASAHIPAWQTTVGLSLDVDDFIWKLRNFYDADLSYLHEQNTRFGIHLARRIGDWFSLGFAIKRFASTLETLPEAPRHDEATAEGWEGYAWLCS